MDLTFSPGKTYQSNRQAGYIEQDIKHKGSAFKILRHKRDSAAFLAALSLRVLSHLGSLTWFPLGGRFPSCMAGALHSMLPANWKSAAAVSSPS